MRNAKQHVYFSLFLSRCLYAQENSTFHETERATDTIQTISNKQYHKKQEMCFFLVETKTLYLGKYNFDMDDLESELF